MPQRLDEATVRHVAHLARLTVTDEEVARFSAQLSAVLDYVEQLDQLDTSDVPPTAHPLPVTNVLRADTPHAPLSRDDVLHNAPDHGEGFFRVPKVLDRHTT